MSLSSSVIVLDAVLGVEGEPCPGVAGVERGLAAPFVERGVEGVKDAGANPDFTDLEDGGGEIG